MTDYTWDASGGAPLDDGAGSWAAAGGTNWETLAVYGAWGNTTADLAVFGVGGGAAGTITVGTVTANGITFNSPGSGNYVLSSGTITLGGTTPTIAANVDATVGSVIAGTVGFTKTGVGTLILSGTNTYTGGTTVTAGTLELSAAAAIQGTGTITVDGGTLQIPGGFAQRLNNQVLLEDNADNAISVTSSIGYLVSKVTGDGGFTLSSGTLVLNSTSNDFAGNIAIDGTLRTNISNVIPDTASLAVNGNWVIAQNFATETIAGLTGSGTIWTFGSTSTRTLIVGSEDTSSTFAGNISNNNAQAEYIALTKIGTGTLILSGTSYYGGDTAVSAGTLEITGKIDTFGSTGTTYTGDIANDAILIFNQSVDQILSGSISGTGSFTKRGTGTLTLSAANTYTGTTSAGGGTLEITDDAGLGAAGITFVASGAILDLQGVTVGAEALIFSSGGTLATSTGTSSLGGGVTLSADSTVDVDGTQLTLSGAISGTGGLTKDGVGTLILSGTNTHTGTVTVSGGTLRYTGASIVLDSVTLDGILDVSGVVGAVQINDLVGVASGSGALEIGAKDIAVESGSTWDGSDTIFTADGGNEIAATGSTIQNCEFDNEVFAINATDGNGNVNVTFISTFGKIISAGRLPTNGMLSRRLRVPVRGEAGAVPTFRGAVTGRSVCILEGFIRPA